MSVLNFPATQHTHNRAGARDGLVIAIQSLLELSALAEEAGSSLESAAYDAAANALMQEHDFGYDDIYFDEPTGEDLVVLAWSDVAAAKAELALAEDANHNEEMPF